MKLLTDIPPRADGVVLLEGKQTYEFKRDPALGALACDIEDEADLALALRSENFYPANQEDEVRALDVVGAATADDDSEPDDLVSHPDAEPIEGKPKRKYTKRAAAE